MQIYPFIILNKNLKNCSILEDTLFKFSMHFISFSISFLLFSFDTRRKIVFWVSLYYKTLFLFGLSLPFSAQSKERVTICKMQTMVYIINHRFIVTQWTVSHEVVFHVFMQHAKQSTGFITGSLSPCDISPPQSH